MIVVGGKKETPILTQGESLMSNFNILFQIIFNSKEMLSVFYLYIYLLSAASHVAESHKLAICDLFSLLLKQSAIENTTELLNTRRIFYNGQTKVSCERAS
jgi:hypothetical protein